MTADKFGEKCRWSDCGAWVRCSWSWAHSPAVSDANCIEQTMADLNTL